MGVVLSTTRQGSSNGQPSHPVNVSGVLLTLLGAVLASLKSVAADALQRDQSPRRGAASGLGLSGLELIVYISPLALVQSLVYAWVAGEVNRLGLLPSSSAKEETSLNFDTPLLLLLSLSCLAALALNIASFEANRRVGALGLGIAGSVKQVLVVVLDVFFGSGGGWTWVSWVGVLGTVLGSCWFVVEEAREKKRDGPRELEAGRAHE
jgi:hypothetical protein